MTKYYVGVDEAGRGPLAGPIAIGIVMVPARLNIKKEFPGLADSKVLTPEKREELFLRVRKLNQEGRLFYTAVFSSETIIDKYGIVRAIRRAVWRGMRRLAPEPEGIYVFLDGLLSAPPSYKQCTVIHGDSTEPIIALASIIAKVRRDALMRRRSKKFPGYGFDVHKGYGTKAHKEAIKLLGLCALHRKSFCTKI